VLVRRAPGGHSSALLPAAQLHGEREDVEDVEVLIDDQLTRNLLSQRRWRLFG
jgi:hypothetical protein